MVILLKNIIILVVTGILGGRLNPRDNPPVSSWPAWTMAILHRMAGRKICRKTCRKVLHEMSNDANKKLSAIQLFWQKKHVTLPFMILKVRNVQTIPFLKGHDCVPPTSECSETRQFGLWVSYNMEHPKYPNEVNNVFPFPRGFFFEGPVLDVYPPGN